MSSGPSFKSILLISSTGVRLWTLERKIWTESSEAISLEKAPSAEVVSLTQGSNLLVLVSDAFNGHLQFISDNKKESLTDDAIGQRLQDDFQIDVGAYEFATQRAALSRDQVQMSVSGVESTLYRQISAWVPALMPRKIWIMPFGWFLVPLKSVEPVLLAVANGKDSMMVSHHYLGVDDARELPLDDVLEYVQSRKEERKETHLLYVQAPAKVLKKLDSSLDELVAVHPLLGESTEDAITEVISAVMAKGADTLAELLHFEEDGPEGVEEVVATGTTSKPKKASASNTDSESDSLPQPVPPVLTAPVAPAMSTRVTIEEDVAEVEADDVSEEAAEDESEEVVTVVETVSVFAADNADSNDEVAETDADSEAEEVVVEPAPVSENLISRLAAEKSERRVAAQAHAPQNSDRYREVAPKRSWGVVALVFVGMVVLTILVGGAIFWSQQVQPQQQALIPSETAPTPTPTPAPKPPCKKITCSTLAGPDRKHCPRNAFDS